MKSNISVGDIFPLSSGTCTVISYERSSRVTVRHNDQYGHISIVDSANLRKGNVRNPYAACLYGFGRIGVGIHACKIGKRKTPAYALWSGIMQRGYCPEFKRSNPSYSDVTVCADWHDFQCFAEWFYSQKSSARPGFQLDKDLIIDGNREYSPEACSFVPSQINSLLNDCAGRRGKLKQGVSLVDRKNAYVARISIKGTPVKIGSFLTEDAAYSAYLSAKTKYVRAMAEEYKPFLHPSVYQNLKLWTL